MKWTVRKLFRPWGIVQEVNKNIEIDEQWKVIDGNKNWYTKVPYFGKVTKVEIAWAMTLKQPRTIDADNLSSTAFMEHGNTWANVVLRNSNGGITEALFEAIAN